MPNQISLDPNREFYFDTVSVNRKPQDVPVLVGRVRYYFSKLQSRTDCGYVEFWPGADKKRAWSVVMRNGHADARISPRDAARLCEGAVDVEIEVVPAPEWLGRHFQVDIGLCIYKSRRKPSPALRRHLNGELS